MIWAFMERELDKIRHNIHSVIDLRKKVQFIWNRIPKKLCKKVVRRFNYLTETVSTNNGNKEKMKDRKDRKPMFKLKDASGWTNKIFTSYSDDVDRISYSNDTFKKFLKRYRIFIQKEVALYKKIKVSVGSINC